MSVAMRVSGKKHLRLSMLCCVAAVLAYFVIAGARSPADVQVKNPLPAQGGPDRVATSLPHATTLPAAHDVVVARAWPGTGEVLADPFGLLKEAKGSSQANATPASAATPVQKPAPAAVTVAGPTAAPAAPQPPFQAVGSINGRDVEGGAWVAFLQQHDEVLVVKVGDLVAGSYRVDAITPQQVELTYVPLKQKQILRFQQ